MDNTNSEYCGSQMAGYPFIDEGGGNYIGSFKILDESPKTDYKRTPTDDLSHIWATNHRDNIDDLDTALREANINAYDPNYHGVSTTDFIAPATKDMWDFRDFIVDKEKIDGMTDNATIGENKIHSPIIQQAPQVLYADPNMTAGETNFYLEQKVCYPLWLVLICVVIAIFGGACLLGPYLFPSGSTVATPVPVPAPTPAPSSA